MKRIEFVIPEEVRIMGVRYKVDQVEDLHDSSSKLDGRILYGKTKIEIEAENSDQLKGVSLIHEAIHGCLSQMEIEHEEKMVSALAFAMVGFLQDNPEVIRG